MSRHASSRPAPPARRLHVPWAAAVAAAAVGLAFFVLYLATLAPGIVTFFDDSLEFQLVLPTFGIAHPTGYPLYTILGGLWSRLLPLREWAWRVNAFSALSAAAAVALVFALGRRLAQADSGPARVDPSLLARASAGGLWAGLVAALLFGLGPVWWAQATVAEVYALHNLLAAAILLAALRAGESGAARGMNLLCALIGLGLAHHRTTLLLLPGVAVYLLIRVPGIRRPRRAWLGWGAALLLPLLLYLYIPARAALGVRDLHGSYVNSWVGFWDHVLARAYQGFFADNALAVARTPADWVRLSLGQLGWAGAALALLGLAAGVWLRTAHRAAWLLIVLVGGVNLAFALSYRVADVEVFLLPVWLCAALLTALGLDGIRRALSRWPGVALGVLILAVLLVALPSLSSFRRNDRSGDWAAHDAAVALASVDFPPASRVIGLEGEVTALKYMQAARGLGAGAEPVAADDEEVRGALIRDGVAAGLPVYLTRELAGIDADYSFSGEGALVRVWPRGAAAPPPPTHALDEAFAGGALRLVGYDLAPLSGTGRPTAQLALHWLPVEPLAQTLKLSLRVLDAGGQVAVLPDGSLAQQDLFPLRMVALTPSWLPGERVRDVYQLPLPPQAGGLRVQIIAYDAATVEEAGRWEAPLE